MAGVPCLLTCASADCGVSASAISLNRQTFRLHDACEALTVTSGAVVVRYRSGGSWFTPQPVGDGQALSDVFKKSPPDTCSVPTPRCLQERMERKANSAGGHGVDGQIAHPAGENSPCVFGLPCGSVLPPADPWIFRLADRGFEGQWQVSVSRGAAASALAGGLSSQVKSGVVSADGRQFSPGLVYAYVLLDRSGRKIASGEFEVLAASRARQLQTLASRRVREGLTERAAWIDTLAASELDWDAGQALNER